MKFIYSYSIVFVLLKAYIKQKLNHILILTDVELCCSCN